MYKYVLRLALYGHRFLIDCFFLIIFVDMPGFLKKLGRGSPEISEGIVVDEIQSSGTSSPQGEKNEKELGASSAHELSEAEAARRLKG